MYSQDYIIFVRCFRYGGGGPNVVSGPASRLDHEGSSAARGTSLLPRLSWYLCHISACSGGGSSLCCPWCFIITASQVCKVLSLKNLSVTFKIIMYWMFLNHLRIKRYFDSTLKSRSFVLFSTRYICFFIKICIVLVIQQSTIQLIYLVTGISWMSTWTEQNIYSTTCTLLWEEPVLNYDNLWKSGFLIHYWLFRLSYQSNSFILWSS